MTCLAATTGDTLIALASSAMQWMGLWAVVSVVAAFAITRLFRARARLNDQLAADGRREDWAKAADASGTELADTTGTEQAPP